jgi:hypothetical protein
MYLRLIASIQAKRKLNESIEPNTKFHQYPFRNHETWEPTGSNLSIMGSVYVILANNI